MAYARLLFTRRLSQTRRRGIALCLLIGGLVAGAGCAGEDGRPAGLDIVEDISRDTLVDPGDVALVETVDTDGPLPPETIDALPPDGFAPAGFMDPCTDNDDCESGWCIAGPDGGTVCTHPCTEGCPEGWECRSVRGTGPDYVFICHPASERLCAPCNVDLDCAGGYCLPLDEELACTLPCAYDRTCPDGWICEDISNLDGTEESPQCVPPTGSCDCSPRWDGMQRPCAAANEAGEVCYGFQTCDGQEGWSECSAQPPTEEVCDGQDNNCDGLVDNDVVPPDEPCEWANEHGTCVGRFVCRGTEGWVCVDSREPQPEICNYRDDNCNGLTDEGFRDPDSGLYVHDEHCGACDNDCREMFAGGLGGCRVADGQAQCVVLECDEDFYRAGDHLCLPVTSSLCLPCLHDVNCAVPGDRCLEIGLGTFCGRDCGPDSFHGDDCPEYYTCDEVEAGVFQCVPENGHCGCTPENDGVERACMNENEYGRCFGTQACSALEGWLECTARTPEPESCDGTDNNCDGLIDFNPVPPEEPCETTYHDPDDPTGEPARCVGEWRCVDAEWVCDVQQAGAEECNYRDDNCDGTVDGPFRDPDSGAYVHVEHCGVCGYSCLGTIANATERCDGTREQPTCVVDRCEPGYVRVSPFTCELVPPSLCEPCISDLNCIGDGDVCLELGDGRFCGRSCGPDNAYGTPEGDCPEGFDCLEVAGQEPQCVPVTGACSCMHEEDLGNRRLCSVRNEYGFCVGEQVCGEGGWSECDARVPAPEVCDGVDNNCDGRIDYSPDGPLAPPAEPCAKENEHGICHGDWVCEGHDGFVCNAQEPSAEICNYQDDNCDGVVDGPFRDENGVYHTREHCGLCGYGCDDAVMYAVETACVVEDGAALCKPVECITGYEVPEANDRVCVPGADTIDCQPCVENAQCAALEGGECTPVDQGTFCTRTCESEADCLDAYVCDEGRCLPTTGSCTCLLQGEAGRVRPCFESNEFGTCTGTQACSYPDGWSACDADTPAAEVCNGRDDDCNGLTDDGVVPPSEACSISNEHGECPGQWSCGGEDGWICLGQVPAPESCNYIDDNCNGLTDELWPELYDVCSEGQGECLRFGFYECTPDGSGTRCNVEPGAPSVEVCDGRDNSCNGLTDDGPLWEDKGQPCVAGIGACARYGVLVCDSANPAGALVCSAVPGEPAAEEQCNGLDDTCNGVTDDGFLVDSQYVHLEHCGACGIDCRDAVPNSTAYCDSESYAAPRCAVAECTAGYIPASPFRCVPSGLGACEPCTTADTCVLDGAACVTLDDGDFCVNPCADPVDCTSGFVCESAAGVEGTFCVPVTHACNCDGSNPDLVRGCEVNYEDSVCYGLQECTEEGWSEVCELPPEVCNYMDDNCDGVVDGAFTVDGRYVTDEHCGGCGNNCRLLTFDGRPGACDALADPPVCSIDCAEVENCFNADGDPTTGCECCDPAPFDRPDPLGIDENCDGMDGEKDNGIFVARHGDDDAAGVFGQPLRTIQAGIAAAEHEGKTYVYVATGVYQEAVVLVPGVEVYGGYSADFRRRDPLRFETAIFGLQSSPELPGAVNAIDIYGGPRDSVVLDGFSVFGYEESRPGVSSYAVYVRGCDETLKLSYNQIIAGAGGRGLRGANGFDGADGVAGEGGMDALDIHAAYGLGQDECTVAYHSPGGSAGVFACDGTETSGGAGGERVCPAWDSANDRTVAPVASQNGLPGAAGGAGGGAAGWDVYHQRFSCDGYDSYGPVEGANGTDGAAGGDGTGGESGGLGGLVTGLWRSGGGLSGANGTFGGGGGGGGSGAGAYVDNSCNSKGYGWHNLGGSGGGGGAGACPGSAGTGGKGGGGAFGLFVVFSGAETSPPIIEHNMIVGGVGGAGGDGGFGGTGGAGGVGGFGGAGGGGGHLDPSDPMFSSYPSFQGGRGGNGGRGGHGGGGAGGAGGPAYGIFAWPPAVFDLSVWSAANDFLAPGAGGQGGVGGFSLGEPGEDGHDGVATDTNF